MLKALTANRSLIRELVARDVRSRYVGSLMGLFWSVLNPILLLALYTFVISGIFQLRFAAGQSTVSLAAMIFCGLLPFLAIQESAIRSAQSYIENNNLIKKVRFPLEALPLKVVISALFHQTVGTLVFAAFVGLNGDLSWTRLHWFPLLLVSQALFSFGAGLAVASLNVYFRDIGQVLGPLFLALFWLTPIVYSREAGGEIARILGLNPFTHLIEAYRWVFLDMTPPSGQGVAYWLAFSAVGLLVGALVLNRTREDVVDFV